MGRFAMASGHLIDIENFTVEDVIIDDIAHHLAKIQRFNGASPLNISYTVGEHCISLANHFYTYDTCFEPHAHELARMALVHDASEAYLSDLVSPVKYGLKDYLDLENRIQNTVYRRFGLNPQDWLCKKLKTADKRILIDEVAAIMPKKLDMYILETNLFSLNCRVEFNNHPSTVKQCFLTMVKTLELI